MRKLETPAKEILTIRLTEDQMESLKKIAMDEDRSLSYIIRRTINSMLTKTANKK